MLASLSGRLSLIFRALMSASCWSRNSGWKNVMTRSELTISEAEFSSEYKNFLTSGSRLSATVLTLDLPTEMPVGRLSIKVSMKFKLKSSKNYKPVKSRQGELKAQLLMQLAKLLVGSEQKSWVGLVLPEHLEDVSVIFLQVVTLLVAMNADVCYCAVLLDASKRISCFDYKMLKNISKSVLTCKSSE